jgi:hypothetical protein
MKRHLAGYALVALVVSAGTALAAGSLVGSSGQIKGCVGSNGVLRVIGPKAKCKPGERALTWNQTGPRGLPGPKGSTGIQGPKGNPGPPGPATGPASGALTGHYPDPQLAAASVGPAQLALSSEATLATTATTTNFTMPLSVTVNVPSATALVEVYAEVAIGTSNAADPVKVDLQATTSGLSFTVAQLFQSTSTSGRPFLQTAPGNEVGVPLEIPGPAGGAIISIPGEAGKWTYALTLLASGGATASMLNDSQLYAVVLN